MPRRSKIPKFLGDITNICEDISDISEVDCKSTDISEVQFEKEKVYVSLDSDSEEENILKVRKRKSVRLPSYSDESEDQQTEIAYDGTIWNKIKSGSSPGRRPKYTIFKEKMGPTGYAKRSIIKGVVSSAFSLLINRQIIQHIITCTKQEAFRVTGEKYDLLEEKFNAFLAILFARGAYEAKNLKLSYLWSQKWGPAFFSKTMPRDDFTNILRFIRFDKKTERSQRLKTDKVAMISYVWKSFIENSQNFYIPGQNITIDAQLFPTKARCRFTQYMLNKPDKFGIKFWLASDLKSKFIISGFSYLGKDATKESSVPLAEFVVLKLIKPYTYSGRNVTTDNFFTSLLLASKLLERGSTLVGTVRAHKTELAKLAKQKKDSLPRFSSVFYRTNNATLTIIKVSQQKKFSC